MSSKKTGEGFTKQTSSRIKEFTHSDTILSQTFDYDALDRLTRFNSTTDTYTYDAVGNRTGLVLDTDNDTYTYAATSNHLVNIIGSNPKNYTYDAAGNTVTEDSRVYTYDGRRRLTKVTEDASISRYFLNALGQRVKKSSTGQGATRFMYDEAGHLLGEYRATGVARQEMVWLGDMPVAVLQGNRIYYVYADHLNTPRVITNTSNTVVWQWRHDEPFGNNAPDDDPDGNGKPFVFNLRFPGQYQDNETGLYYNYFRDYDPGTGRYVQSDPIGLRGGANIYVYVNGNPINYTDPLGLIWPWNCYQCFKYYDEFDKAEKQCKKEYESCKDIKDEIEFLEKHGGGFPSSAILNCATSKAPGAFKKLLENCGKCAIAPKGASRLK